MLIGTCLSKTRRDAHTPGRFAALGAILAGLVLSSGAVSAQTLPTPPRGMSIAALPKLVNTPQWLAPAWHTALTAPLPSASAPSSLGAILPQLFIAADQSGLTAAYQPGTATYTYTNPFFQPLGTNGRSCATCHSPESAMGLSLSSIQSRYLLSAGKDPLFAPIDGATCPSNVPSASTIGSILGNLLGGRATPANIGAPPYATLLGKGLFRVALPVPAGAEFSISVVSDPYGCNTNQAYDQAVDATGATRTIISVYRRPLIAANLAFKVNTAVNTGILPPYDLISNEPLPRYTPVAGTSYGSAGNGPIETGNIQNGNLMSDGREPNLASQAIDAVLIHAQGVTPPTPAQVAQILAFEDSIYVGQYADALAGPLSGAGVTGGPQALASDPIGTIALAPGASVMTLYNAWNPSSVMESPWRASIYRGQQIFNARSFTISNVAGFNNAAIIGSNAFKGTCSTCHGQLNVGDDPTPNAQHDIGIGGDLSAFGGPKPATDLPIFKLTCNAGAKTAFNGSVVITNDPGRALITGKCADIGRFTVGVLRGLAARPPYFSDGSAPSLSALASFYNDRFAIGLSIQDRQDLVNFLNTL